MALTKVSTGVVDMSGNTGRLVIAKGNDLERPASPSIGMIRESTETTPSKVEVYTDNGGSPDWQFLKEVGPTLVPLTVDYLVVAGGGGGASGYGAAGAGGGAGELLYKTAQTLTVGGSGYTVTVGAGGIGGQVTSSTVGSAGTQGSDSIFIQTTKGGGFGRPAGGSPQYVYVGSDGGSGGGGAFNGTGGASTAVFPGLGFAGGAGWNGFNYGCGGGGGAGSAGINGYSGSGGNGGAGVQNSIAVASGSGPYYAAGGGGGLYNQSSGYGIGGSGIGGSSYCNQNTTGGAPNTGSGGGGGSYCSGTAFLGGAGSSGILILKYPSVFTIDTTQIGTNLSSTNNNSVSGYTITTIICANSATTGTGTITFA